MRNNAVNEDLKKRVSSRIRKVFGELYLERELKTEKEILKYQKWAIVALFVIYVGYKIFGKYIPDFDLSFLWNRTDDIWGSVAKYWYVFAWGTGLAILLPTVKGSFSKAKQIFRYEVVTSTLAGLWEEIGYRGLYIFTAMISIIIANMFLKYILILIVGVIIIYIILKMKGANFFRLIVLIGGVAVIILMVRANFVGDPLYWIYQKIVYPLWHYCSLGLLDPILYNKNFSFLFIIGAMSANIKFRDGHKYQGWFGYMNAWIVGYILLHAMMTYGLVVAIIIHAVYDILIGLVRFIKRIPKTEESE